MLSTPILSLCFEVPLMGWNLEGTGYINPFVKGLFSAKAIAAQVHPRNEDTAVAAQQAVKPMRAPSTWRKNAIKRMPTINEGGDVEEQDREEDKSNPPEATLTGGASPCVAGEFKSALGALFPFFDRLRRCKISMP
jgi:chitin synthase